MSQATHWKIPFVWEGETPLVEVPQRLTFQPIDATQNRLLVSIAVRVFAASLDASHQKQASQPNPHQAVEEFLKSAGDDFSYERNWWQFGVNATGEIVGFVLPVLFKDCAKGELEEGTIYDIGVLPEYRGFGFAKDLLLQATRTLQEVGIWRIFCDTAVNNAPMIATFKRVGYHPYGEPWERPV